LFIHLLQLGRVPYAEGLAIQARVVAARKAGLIGDTLLLLEHPPVITLGRNSSRANILASDEFLAARNVELHEINRGGDVTYHGPGQLIGYPIVDLRGEWPGKKGPFLGPVDFVRMMEEALIRTCADFGVMAKRIPKCTGVWTFGGGETGNREQATGNSSKLGAPHLEKMWNSQPSTSGSIREKKLAAIGVHVSQGVTSHGFALNVTTDLRDFDWIVPCGITDRGVTSLELEADPATDPTMERAANSASRNFGRVFGRQMLWCESLDQLLAPALQAAAESKAL
jgi:lipoyl(octanoyl) transferase